VLGTAQAQIALQQQAAAQRVFGIAGIAGAQQGVGRTALQPELAVFRCLRIEREFEQIEPQVLRHVAVVELDQFARDLFFDLDVGERGGGEGVAKERVHIGGVVALEPTRR
jgi:hypothetical protein